MKRAKSLARPPKPGDEETAPAGRVDDEAAAVAGLGPEQSTRPIMDEAPPGTSGFTVTLEGQVTAASAAAAINEAAVQDTTMAEEIAAAAAAPTSHVSDPGTSAAVAAAGAFPDEEPPSVADPQHEQAARQLLHRLVAATEGWLLVQLENWHAQMSRLLSRRALEADRALVLEEVEEFVARVENMG